MNLFQIHSLGCGSAKPTFRHQPSCSVVNHRGNLYMIDCGEGAQLAFMRQRLKFQRLNHIFLTHLHGDHVLGLPGLLSTMALSQQGGEITVHTFKEGEEILTKILNFFARERSFDLKFNIIAPEDTVILDTPSLLVRTVRLSHRVPTVGYVFEEKVGARHIRPQMIERYSVPKAYCNMIKAGMDYTLPNGDVIPNALLTSDPTPPLSYAHISDTRYMPDLANKIKGVNLLFHETTYCEQHLADATARYHSTAKQAATVARDAGALALLTGHYSSRYRDDNQFAAEASEVFDGKVILNKEGLITDVPQRE